MKALYKLLPIVFLFINFNANAQQLQRFTSFSDTAKSPTLLKKSIVPVGLITLGLLANNSNFEKEFKTNLRNKVGNGFEFKIDDYLQFAPIAEMYVADLLGVAAKNHWFDQSKYLFISEVVATSIVYGLKIGTQKTRPNGGEHSFPSGHTAFAFTNATVLFNEFHETAPVLAYSGYALATTTGAFRMINNKHWLSDVLVGAGIGIVVTHLVYHFEPLKGFNPFKNSKNITFLPQINNDNYGFYFSYKM
jgi:membrane-associated phospholipid phosphatase